MNQVRNLFKPNEAVKLCRKTHKQLHVVFWTDIYRDMKGSTYTVLFRNALSTSTSWLPWVKLLWHINDFSAVVISCRCRRSSSSPSKHHILSRSNVSSRKPFSYKLTLFEASAVNEICKKFPKQKASVLIITGNLLTFKITSMKKLRTSDRLKTSVFRCNTSANY